MRRLKDVRLLWRCCAQLRQWRAWACIERRWGAVQCHLPRAVPTMRNQHQQGSRACVSSLGRLE